jgi:predicted membrane-bound spermidine synthase
VTSAPPDVAAPAARVDSPLRSVAASALVCCAFFASGAAALTFETLWFHQAALVFGNSVWASSLVLSGFMAGMAFGSAWAARLGERLTAPLRAFALLEIIVGVSGVVLVYALPWLTPLTAALSASLERAPLVLNGLRFGFAFALLLVPSTAMGMTLPLLARGVRAWDSNFGRVLGVLYGFNTLGAVCGVLVTEGVFVESLGIRHSALAALGFNLAAAGIGWIAATADPALPPPGAARVPWRGARWLLAGFASGFAMLALEVVWLRCLTLFLNDTPLAFALVLASVLAGIALGSFGAAWWAARSEDASQHAGFAAIAAAIAGVITYRGFSSVLEQYFRPEQSAGTILAIACPLIVPTALASGALFTLLGTGLQRTLSGDAVSVGRLALANMVGGGLGSLSAGFLLLPYLGMEKSLFALLALFALTGVLLVLREGVAMTTRLTAVGIAVIGLAFFPWGEMRARYLRGSASRFMRAQDEIVSVREGVTGTLVHVAHRLNGLTLFDHLATNAYAMTANDFAARRYMKQFVYLPEALHPKLERALVVGYGIGSTAAALLDDPELKHLDIADISRDILKLSREMRAGPAHNPLDDRRVTVHLEDGRQLLAAGGAGYDLITGEPPPPVIAGVVNLYTREYFELVRSRLARGGMATHWLPLMNLSAPAAKSIIHAFCDAFPDCSLWHGSARNFMLFGTRDAAAANSAERFSRLWQRPSTLAELQKVGFELPEQLGAAFIGDGDYLRELTRDVPALIDDTPRLIQTPGPREDRDAMIWEWRDTRKTRERFLASPLTERLWPSDLRARTARQFENQRLLNDLLFPEQTPVRQTQVLHQVMQGTRLRLPILLMLNSDPEIQDQLAKAPESVGAQPEWQVHRLAGALADREYGRALRVLREMPKDKIPLTDLLEYVEFVVERNGGSMVAPR